jgi:4-hydroxy-tetrahydrodipicolinate synthase
MSKYLRHEAREWTRQYMRGVDCVLIPTFIADLTGLNKAAIQYDVRKLIEFGFNGALLCADIAFSPDEYIQFAQWAHEAADGKLKLVHHAAFNTLEQNIDMAKRATPYCDYVLLCYPANFYPQTEQDVYNYTRAFCDNVDMGVMLFPVPLWNFGRLHPAQMSMPLLRRLVDDCPTIVAIKAEGDLPGIGGLLDVYRQFKDVIVSCPLETEIVPLMAELEFQYSGTNYSACYGDYFPRMFDAAVNGDQDKAMDMFWKLHPARQAHSAVNQGVLFSGVLNRMMWKFQDWTMGLNGGPLRQPTGRIGDNLMGQWRRGIEAAGLGLPSEPNANFYIGRNPA